MPSLQRFFFSLDDSEKLNLKWGKEREHLSYRESIFVPVAPEWATGEVLVGAAYRKLLLNERESVIDREMIKSLPQKLKPSDIWDELFRLPTGLASPPSPRDTLKLPQLMPLVPSIARYACVLGHPRSRWDPGNLLVSTIGSGCSRSTYDTFLKRFQDALAVKEHDDDLFAQFLEFSLMSLSNEPYNTNIDLSKPKAPAWRSIFSSSEEQRFTPAERFCKDLDDLLILKPHLTRRQWMVQIEALLRVGLTCHELWLCQLAYQVWGKALEALETGTIYPPEDIEASCWMAHLNGYASLELGKNALPLMKTRVRENAEARIGLTLLLSALEKIKQPWESPLGVCKPANTRSPAEEISLFLGRIAMYAQPLVDLFQNVYRSSPRDFAARVADANPELLGAASGYTHNLFEFLRYNQLQLQTKQVEQGSYDQAYLLLKKNKATNAPWIVQPGPATLIMMVHACCQSQKGIPTSMDDFRSYLGFYGIYAPAGELQDGQTGRHLEQLGLVVDSPDAGGGRLLVDPF